MERLLRNTEMFAPAVSYVVVLNHVPKPELWPFKHPRDFSSGAYFSLQMIKIRLLKCKQSQSLQNRFLRRTQTNRIKTVIIGKKL